MSGTPRGRYERTGASEDRRAAIVVGLDGRAHDADAIALATALRGAFEGEIVLVHVVPEAPPGRGMVELQSLDLHEGQDLLARAAATIPEPVDVELINPWPASLALERVAFKRHASLIVLGSSHRNSFGRIVPGAVALRLLKGAPCAIAVAPGGYAEHRPTPITSVAVAYDATNGSDRALQAAAAAATRMKVALHVYHAIPYEEPNGLGGARMIEAGRAILDRAREQLPPRLNPLARELFGDPAAAIVQAARDDEIGLLFTGSRGHGPLREGLFGGVCRGILQSAPCPVVLIPHEARSGVTSPAPDQMLET